MIVTSTSGRIGSIECDRISFSNGQAVLWREDSEREGVFCACEKLPADKIAWILNHSSLKKED